MARGVAVIAHSAADVIATQAVGLRMRVIEHPALARQIALIESTRRPLSAAAHARATASRAAWPSARPG